MNRENFLATILLTGFKLRDAYKLTYDLNRIYIYTYIYVNDRSSHITVENIDEIKTYKEYFGGYKPALKYALYLLNK